MKWAQPAWSAPSRRDPARTWASIVTDRDPGSRAEMTRGPSGSAVRSNSGRTVADRPPDGAPGPAAGTPSSAPRGSPQGQSTVLRGAILGGRGPARAPVRGDRARDRPQVRVPPAERGKRMEEGHDGQPTPDAADAARGGRPDRQCLQLGRRVSASPSAGAAGCEAGGGAGVTQIPTSSRASSTWRWSSSGPTTTAAGARPTTRASSTCARTRPTRTSPTSRTCRGHRLRAGLPQPVAEGLQLHHRHLLRLHGSHGDRGQGVPRSPTST